MRKMRLKKNFWAGVVFFLLALHPSVCFSQTQAYDAHASVEMIPSDLAVYPGQRFSVAVMFTMDPEWYIYWINPGDSGMAPQLSWTYPEYFEPRELHWPYPQKIDAPPLASFGYQGRTVLFQDFFVSPHATPGETALVELDMRWLTCRVDCIPGKAHLSLEIPVLETARVNEKFDQHAAGFLSQIPLKGQGRGLEAFLKGDEIILDFSSLAQELELDRAQFFSFDEDALNHAQDQEFRHAPGLAILIMKVSRLFNPQAIKRLEGVLVLTRDQANQEQQEETRSFEINVGLSKSPIERIVEGLIEKPAGKPAGKPLARDVSTVWLAVLFAFIGGLILNLLPCVLPVLSINVLNLIQQAGQSPKKIWQQGLFFTLGIVSMFWVLMALLFIFKAVGYQIGWGFQFQQPVVLIFLCALFFALTLYLWGMVSIGTGTVSISGMPARTNTSVQSFWRGVLMTVCATPCTAPFMGAALGFALTQPYYVAVWVFSAMGLGMALPYVALSRFPVLLRYVPKPGQWMNHVKVFFGFVLLLTVVYLSDILGQQAGVAVVIALYYFLGLSALSAWLWQVLTSFGAGKSATKIFLVLLPFVIGLVIVGASLRGIFGSPESRVQDARSSAILWKPYSPEAFDQALKDKKNVFINFTAAWCMTCKINDMVAFSDPQVAKALNSESLVAFKADWTNYDADITQALARYGRTSIPFYVYHVFSELGEQDVVTLPELVSPGVVLRALKNE